MKKKISIGISDFKELIEKNNYFIDKSLLIKEFIDNGAKIILTPRPRRFGKTLNLSMLKYFFDIQLKEQTKDLFKELKIEKEIEIMKMQGNYPVIFISFKNQKQFSIDDLYISIKNLIKTLFDEHNYLLKSNKLSKKEKEDMQHFINGDIQKSEVSEGLSILTKLLSKHYDKKVMLFIDEYDIPIQESYVRGYYDEGIAFMRNILSAALKDNEYLEKAMITGILRVAKESIFSGLNNLEVDTILGYNFNDKFGFEQNEVDTLLKYYNLQEKLDEIGEWYNGYLFGGNVIYNPWSVLNYLKNNRIGFMPYWINTSDNILIKKLLSKGNKETKQSLENLIEGKTIIKIINDHIVMKDVEEEPENIWSFLTMCGYLKVVHQELIHGRMHCELKIPNKEVKIFYEDLIEKWFSESLSTESYNDMLKALTTKDIETFEEIFTDFVLRSMSYFDIDGKAPEKVYHAFVLGMIVSLNDNYQVKSNRESGYGRYDVMLIPKDISKTGIIIEFKRIKETNPKTIDEGIQEALNQIEKQKYETELRERNINDILKLAIVFKGKEVKIIEGLECRE